MGLNWNSLKWVQGEMRKQSLRGHHCCSSMVLVMAHGALRYVTCLATVYLYVPSLQACMFSLNKSKHYRVCMCAYEVKASFCIPACILCMQGSIGHLPFGPSSPTLYLSCATFYFYANYCFHAKLHVSTNFILQCCNAGELSAMVCPTWSSLLCCQLQRPRHQQRPVCLS